MSTVRRAGRADAGALTDLRAQMFLAMGKDVSGPWHEQCVAALERRLGEDGFVAFVVDHEGRPVSSGVGWVEEHLPSPHQLDPRRGHIGSMSTDPAHRRQGHARAVFGALMGWFEEQGIGRVDLRATPDGLPLYASFGFERLQGATMYWTAPGVSPGITSS